MSKGIVLLFLFVALTPRIAKASCTFTYTCGGSCGDLGSSGTIGPIPGDAATCASVRAGDIFAWEKLGSTISASECRCSGGDSGVGVGLGPVGGLNNDFGASDPVASESGRPSFTPHYSENFERWEKEAELHTQAYASLSHQPQGVSSASVRYQRQFAGQVRRRYCDPGPCRLTRRYASSAVGSRIQSIPPRFETAAPATEGTQPVDLIRGGGPPITGTGVQVGPKDTPPPPSPQRVENDRLCRKSWWFNTATRLCYPTRDSCWADGVTEKTRECILHRP